MNLEEAVSVKAESEARIIAIGGKICDWLPALERLTPRTSAETCDRILAMHAMLQLAFNAPKRIIAAWLRVNQLDHALSCRERWILSALDEELDRQTQTDLHWSIEAVWALSWVGGLIPDLDITTPVGNNLASLLPNLKLNESAANFRANFKQRPFAALFKELDLYYRAHWYARDGQLCNYKTEPFSLDIIMERRKALEWVCDASTPDWDDTQDGT